MLADERFLVKLNGHYARVTSGRHLTVAKAELSANRPVKKAS
jgi:hypothetical protein